SREARDRNGPVRADQMSWSNSTMRENINRFDAARQPDRFYGRLPLIFDDGIERRRSLKRASRRF
ncbi:hypothetical protein, partial [Methylocystis sp.]|uniref:hypothetical protein n=1 Tax=Methylocystis sp. TaxID=1911079 RepID=UPI002600CEA4